MQQHTIQYAYEEVRSFIVDPHRQAIIDLQHFVQELKDKGHHILIFIDANEDEQHQFQEQGHVVQLVTKNGFHVDGRHNGSLGTMMDNCSLINAIKELNDGYLPNTHNRGTRQIDCVLCIEGLLEYFIRVGFLDSSVLGSDHKGLFAGLNTAGLTGEGTEGLKKPQFRNLRLDDPRVSAAYRKILHNQFEHHNVYRWVKKLQEEANETKWSIMNEQTYEGVDKDITAAMHHAEKICKWQKQHLTPWANSVGQGKNAIRYWDVRIWRGGRRHLHDGVLNCYLARSDVDTTLDIYLPLVTCTQEAVNARAKFKDTMKLVKESGTQYKIEVATARVERKYPHIVEGNVIMTLEREATIQKELKRRKNKRVSQGSFKKLGRQIRGHINPSSLKKTSLTRLDIPDKDRVWK
jgi:hypothetical protein